MAEHELPDEGCNAALPSGTFWPEFKETRYCGAPAEWYCEGYVFCRLHAEELTGEGRKMEPWKRGPA